MASSTVFISYRREDSAGHAGRLFDRLASKLGHDHVFRDVDNIRPGENFVETIRQRIDDSNVLFVLIGPRWLSAADGDGRRRLEDTSDLVRLEIELGLQRKMRVIPVLLPGAAMPNAKELPNTLAPLVKFNAYEIRETHFDQDVLQLIAEAQPPSRLNPLLLFKTRPIYLIVSGAVCVAVIALALFWAHPASLMTSERARDQLARMNFSYDTETFQTTARAGDAAAISLFLRAGMKPDAKTPGTPSALESALDEGHFAVAQLLIQAGANVNRALLSVAQSGNEDLFHLLLSKKPSQEGLAGALYEAAGSGHATLVKQLLDMGVSANDKWRGNVPLQAAAYGGQTDVVKLLLNRGADANAVDTGSGGTGETALHYATRSKANTLNIVGLLLGAGASVNVQDKSGKTPLMNALDHRDMVFLLLESRANVNLRDDGGGTALMYAAGRHLTGIIKALVDKGADINAQNDHGWTPLMFTSGAIDSVDDPETVQAVLDNGADINKQDLDGWTALMYTAQRGLNGAARVLIGAGADRDKRNKDGQTALQLATINARTRIVSMLSSHHR